MPPIRVLNFFFSSAMSEFVRISVRSIQALDSLVLESIRHLKIHKHTKLELGLYNSRDICGIEVDRFESKSNMTQLISTNKKQGYLSDALEII